MSETTTAATELASQYSAQVTGDLEHNLKEQERLSGEIQDLRQQLAALEQDHTVLLKIQQALALPASPAAPEPESESGPSEPSSAAPESRSAAPERTSVAAVPAPRKKTAAKSGGASKRARAKKSPAPQRERAGRKSAAPETASPSALPTLVDLVRGHLADQVEPRSAAEVTAALAQQHPERAARTTVVRSTLEGLVARNQAQRSKQGTSVFYTASDPAEPVTDAGQSPDSP
ncbi:hypothetical protein ACFZCP_44715 [Streptomyces sp. NPDC007971]|uniref:hypothetical protein n=1 Tax=Streptomyces sp. NPDC007971 TaxID=3364799 RepID=UPI0036E9336A